MSPLTLGIAFGLATTVCWCFSSLCFEAAGRRVGSVPVNVIRLALAFVLLTAATAVLRGVPLPSDVSPEQWFWLAASGLVGFFLGDLVIFRSYVLVGARMSSLIACTAPIFALLAEALLLRKYQFSGLGVIGVLLTVAGVVWVVAERRETGSVSGDDAGTTAGVAAGSVASGVAMGGRRKGVVLAVLGSLAQGLGAVLTARAFEAGPCHPLAAVQVRMIAAVPAFIVFMLLTRRLADTIAAVRNPGAMLLISLGAVVGPFLGVTFFTTSLQYVPPSITQTMVSLVPIVLIPVVVLTGRERVSPRAMLGTLLAVGGVYVLIHSMP